MFTPSTQTVGKTFRWIVLLPVLMVGSMLYWSVALGLGGLSLMAASALSITPSLGADRSVSIVDLPETGPSIGPVDVEPTTDTTPIIVHLEESVEPEDVNDNVGAAGFTQVNDDQQVTVTPGPGATSY